MKKYDSYKDSGIEWIGEIPSHWEVVPLKYLSDNFDSKRVPLNSAERAEMIGDYPYYGATGIVDYINNFIFDGEFVLIGEDGAPFFIQGKDVAFIAEGKFWVNNHAHILQTNDKILSTIFCHQLNCVDYKGYITGSTRDKLTQDQLKSIKLLLPSKAEQNTIANYLDQKTTQIDDLIAKKERLIQLLEEERTAIINHAVTKGLDTTVPMKDSGIEWLGEIPVHWEVKKLKYVKSTEKNAFVDGPFGSNLKTEHFIENGDVYVIDSGYITSGEFKIKRGFKTISLEHFETVKRSECKARDIIIAKIGANFGMSGILPELDKPSLVSGNTLKLTIDENYFDLEFIHLQLLNLKTSGEIDLLVKGSAQPALSMGVMSELPFVIPKNKEEQILVREHIKTNHKRIDNLISKVSNEIELLKEYKTALISEVVTGKVDVREEKLS